MGRCAVRLLRHPKVPLLPPQQMTVSQVKLFISFVKKRWKGEVPIDYALCDRLLEVIGAVLTALLGLA